MLGVHERVGQDVARIACHASVVVSPLPSVVRGGGWVRLTMSKLEEHADDAFLAVLGACSR